MAPPFGIPVDVIIADSNAGAFKLLTTSYQICISNDSFPRISIEGIIGDSLITKASRQEELRRFTLLELMDEVGRRIKSGENKKEKMKP